MEVKYFILSVACFSCLVPPAYSSAILAKKAAAVAGVAKGAALGVGALAAKGLALKGAALLTAKGLAVKSAALLAAKGAVAKGALLGGAFVLQKKLDKVSEAIGTSRHFYIGGAALPHRNNFIPRSPTAIITPPRSSTVIDRLTWLTNVTKAAIETKTSAVGDLLSSLLPTKTVVAPTPLIVVTAPRFYPVPVIPMRKKK